jgi:hypothetical protein
VRLFGVVVIPTGEGACAWPGGSAYPHYCSLLTRVDSAEADRVGSREIRFCAYVSVAPDEGMRHYRTTLGALHFLSSLALSAVSVIAGLGSPRRAGRYPLTGTSSCRICGRFAMSHEPDLDAPIVA